ncbi:hypothetical protein B0H12DRAFT_1114279 [Mycena haematopus]|nr:hypothetical protein B0H12DRAFT_1114279 [Mycena haematopus]
MCTPRSIEGVASKVTVYGKKSGYEAIFTVGTEIDERNGHSKATDGLYPCLASGVVPLHPCPAQRWKGIPKSLEMRNQIRGQLNLEFFPYGRVFRQELPHLDLRARVVELGSIEPNLECASALDLLPHHC